MCYNYNKKLLFLGTVDSFSLTLSTSPESFIPVLYCVECNGHTVTYLDRLMIPGEKNSHGIFSVQSHPSENIIFCAFNTSVLVVHFEDNRFGKLKIVKDCSESSVYQSIFSPGSYSLFCPKSKKVTILDFNKPGHQQEGPDKYLEGPSSQDIKTNALSLANSKFSLKALKCPLKKDNIHQDVRILLVDEKEGLVFIFADTITKFLLDSNFNMSGGEKSVELFCYQADLVPCLSRVVVCVNMLNDLVVLDYDLNVQLRVEGIKAQAFSDSLSRSTISDQDPKLYNWLKGNHQSALIDIVSGEEKERAPLFGSVNTYTENIPLLSAYCNGNWAGFYFQDNKYYFSWISQKADKQTKEIEAVIPEAKVVHQMIFSPCGKYVIVLVSSSQDNIWSNPILAVLQFGNFGLTSFRRMGAGANHASPTRTLLFGADFQLSSRILVAENSTGLLSLYVSADGRLQQYSGSLRAISQVTEPSAELSQQILSKSSPIISCSIVDDSVAYVVCRDTILRCESTNNQNDTKEKFRRNLEPTTDERLAFNHQGYGLTPKEKDLHQITANDVEDGKSFEDQIQIVDIPNIEEIEAKNSALSPLMHSQSES